jgi:hypothetical protein
MDWDRSMQNHTAVAFVAWNWFGVEITIIPDGFGTHAGTGGWGFSLAISLIRSMDIPIHEVVYSEEAFERLCNARLTKKDISVLKDPMGWSPFWSSYLRERHEKALENGNLWNEVRDVDDRILEKMPRWVLSPPLFNITSTFDKDSSSVIRTAALILEETVRKLSSLPSNQYGMQLMGNAFSKDGPLRFNREDENVADAWALLYKGFIGAIRNPLSHRLSNLKPYESLGYIMLCDLLLRQLHRENKLKPNDDMGS